MIRWPDGYVDVYIYGGGCRGLMMILGFNFVSMFPIILLGVGAFHGFLGQEQYAKKTV